MVNVNQVRRREQQETLERLFTKESGGNRRLRRSFAVMLDARVADPEHIPVAQEAKVSHYLKDHSFRFARCQPGV